MGFLGDVGRKAGNFLTLGGEDRAKEAAAMAKDAGMIGASYIQGVDQNAYRDNRALGLSRDLTSRAEDRANMQVGQDVRGQQMALAEEMRRRAMGVGGPSVAENQLNQAMDRRVADARSMALSMDGMNPAAVAYMAQRGGDRAMADTAGQMATLRAQEQIAAQQSLAGLLGNTRGQDITTQQATDQATQGYYNLGLGANRDYRQGLQAGQAANLQAQLARAGMIGQAYGNAANIMGGYGQQVGGIVSGAMGQGIAMMSGGGGGGK